MILTVHPQRELVGSVSDHLVATILKETLKTGIHVNVMPVCYVSQDDGIRAGVKGFDKALLGPLQFSRALCHTVFEFITCLPQLFFALYPLCDVLGMAQDVRRLPRLFISDIVIGPDPFLAVFRDEAHQTTVCGLGANAFQIRLEEGPHRRYQKQTELFANPFVWL